MASRSQRQERAPSTATAIIPALSDWKPVNYSDQVSAGRMARARGSLQTPQSALPRTSTLEKVNEMADEKQAASLQEVVVWSQVSCGWASSSWQPLWSKLASISTPVTAAQITSAQAGGDFPGGSAPHVVFDSHAFALLVGFALCNLMLVSHSHGYEIDDKLLTIWRS
eukprot:CAMPEP_0119333376 /NCGR_PEP_ID=MMETSP1333-20130426/85033_1 /TAXON_ID=418940 /ORGANISM="Scyphosphaera apsteinii, Strain RCC1455" /LENGTH=167 /DNA_ID=CAMNT_0007343427 /DNA_START=69 /DNA_END=570 /DNA_ORIENTATION=+